MNDEAALAAVKTAKKLMKLFSKEGVKYPDIQGPELLRYIALTCVAFTDFNADLYAEMTSIPRTEFAHLVANMIVEANK